MKYKTILADPPWTIHFLGRKATRPNQVINYSIMSLNEIKSLEVDGIKIRDLTDSQCHLYLWATHKWLPRAFEVMKAWGFKYHCCIVWDKSYGITPFSFMFSTEFCLFGYKGKFNIKRKGVKTLIQEKPTGHSRKPFGIYDVIEKASYPPYLELFARPHSPLFPKKEGWEVWGDEIKEEK